jgi:hypothetical protein
MNVPRLQDSPISDETVKIINDDDINLTDSDINLSDSEEEEKEKVVEISVEDSQPRLMKSLPTMEDVERMIVKSIIENQSFFTCLYLLHEHFQICGVSSRKDKNSFRDRILNEINAKVPQKKIVEVQTLLNNFLQLC